MTLEELYDRIGGNYTQALAYMRMERLVSRLIVKFLDDTSLPRLFAAWEAKDMRAAFEAAHEAKGVCSNLYLTQLAALASAVTEALRPGAANTPELTVIEGYVDELHEAYDNTIAEISTYAASL